MKKKTPPPTPADLKATRKALEADHQRHLKAAEDSGDLDRAARLISMAYITFTEANNYVERANDLLTPYGLVQKKIKTTVNNLTQSFDAYNKNMASIIDTKAAQDQLCNDSDIFQQVLDAFMSGNLTVRRNRYYAPTLFLPSK